MIGRLLVLTAALLFVAACTSDPDSSSPTDPTIPLTTIPATTTTTVAQVEALDEFRACLSEDDVTIEPITLDGQGRPRLDLAMSGLDFTDAAVIAALSRCSELLAAGALDLTDAVLIGDQVVSVLTQFSECVRSQGVPDFPDPIPGFIGIGGPYPVAEIPYADPDLETAVAECRRRIADSTG